MKSTRDELKTRGMAFEEDRLFCKDASEQDLLIILTTGTPSQKSAACERLRALNQEVITSLLQCLCKEKHLYTKIAICECLEKGDQKTAKCMCEYLGKIGKNQHRKLPDNVSKKKSYPLPRDIIARSLGKMNPSVFPVLLAELDHDHTYRNRELIDAIGFMVFYHPELVNDETAQKLITLLIQTTDEVLIWKILLCFSAFPLAQIEEILRSYMQTKGVLADEAMRSLHLIKERKALC